MEHMAHQRHGLFLSLLSLLLLLPIPTDTSRAGQGLVMHNVDEAGARKTRERIKIYSVLKSHDMKLSEASLWNVTESVVEESAKHSLDPMLVLAVIKVESRFDHRAVSPRGALGLMQIRPIVVDELVDEGKIPERKSKKNLRDPILNIKIGVAYLSYLKKMFSHLPFALAAYNSGPTRIRVKLEAKEKIPLGYANKVVAVQLSFNKHMAAA
jgi:soluble lytic murein transglycosylase-like protein